MQTIPLTQGKVTLVDDADYPVLSQFKWFAMKSRAGRWCVGRNAPKQDGKRGTIYMHRQILGFPILEVDHRDRNALNNQRLNLRLATDLQQVLNRSGKPGKCGFKGVAKRCRKFEARINRRGHYLCIGYFDTAEGAARAYDAAAREIHGEFAVLNFA